MRFELEGVGRLVERDPRPERPERHVQGARRGPDVLLDEQESAGGRFGRQQREVVLAKDASPHEPEQEAQLTGRHPAVGEGHRRLGQSPAGRDDLVEQVGLQLADERAERTRVGADPARPIDDAGPFDDTWQRAAERRRQGGHDARHGLGVGRLRGRQLARRQGPSSRAEASDRDPLDLRPVDEATGARRPFGTAARDRGGGAQRRTKQEPDLPDAVIAPRRAAAGVLAAGAGTVGHRAGTARSIRSTSGKADPNSRLASAWNVSGSPVVSWRCVAGVACGIGAVGRRRTRRSSGRATGAR